MPIIYVRDGNGNLVPVSFGSVPNPDGNVAYDKAQKLTEEQKIQARENIGAQPVGNYLTSVPAGYATEDFVRRVITESASSSVFFSGSTAVITPQELVDQLASGKCIAINHEDADFGNIVFTGFTVIGELGVITATSVNSFVFDDVEVVMRYELVGDFQSNKWYFKYAPIGGTNDSQEFYPVHFTDNDGTWTADKTRQEVYEAHRSGKIVYCTIYVDNLPCIIHLRTEFVGNFIFEGVCNGKDIVVGYTCDDSVYPVIDNIIGVGITDLCGDSGGNVDQTNKWSGKIASFIGDSITAGINTEKTYHAFLREKVGFSTCNNYGIDGSSVSNKNAPMCTRVSNVAENSDIIFVFGGTNDFYLSVPMGEWYTIDGTTRAVNYDTSTFKGALSTLCNALLTRFSDRKIVLMTPLHRHTFGSQYTELQENAQGLHLENYVDAVKEAGKMYGLPVIDLYGESGLFPRNEANAAIYFHTNDKLHPNAKGHEVIANVILGFLEKTYPMVSGQASDEPEIPEIPEVTMTSISATYSGGDVTEGTPVTALTGIVVTAHYSDGTNETVTGYTLFGTITEGNNTITVGYQGKNAVFTVVGVAQYAFLYKLPEAKTFNGTSDYIDTGVNLIEQDIDWTIAFDAVTAKTIGGYTIGIFYCMQTTQPWPGYCFKIQDSMYVFAAGDSYANTNIPDRANMGMKVVITHKAGSNEYSVKYLYDGTISEVSATWAFVSGSTSLYIGAYNQGGITGFWTGTVNDFKVYNGVLSDSAIEAYLT